MLKRFFKSLYCKRYGHDIENTVLKKELKNLSVMVNKNMYIKWLPVSLYCNRCGDKRFFYYTESAESFLKRNPIWRPYKLQPTITSKKQYNKLVKEDYEEWGIQ